MYYQDRPNDEIMDLDMTIIEMAHYKLDKEENILDVYYHNYGEDECIKIEDIRVEKDKDGKPVIALIADTNYTYEVTTIKIQKIKSIFMD